MTYLLTGNYRGEVSGSAQVEWIRVGSHYQVHVDFIVGPKFAPLITQRFEAVKRVADIGSPLLVVHGAQDQLISPALGRRLYEAATGKKAFVLVENGSHHNTEAFMRAEDPGTALAELFGLPP